MSFSSCQQFLDPAPPSLPDELEYCPSDLPTDLVVPSPHPLPDDISVPTITVPFHIYHRLIPMFFTLSNSPSVKQPDQLPLRSPILSHKCAISNSQFNRSVLSHAYYGFTFQTAPYIMQTLTNTAPTHPPSIHSNNQTKQTLQQQEHQPNYEFRAANLQKNLLAINLKAISNLLNSSHTHTFTLSLTATPYFGRAALQARLSFLSPELKLVSFHLLAISRPNIHIPDLILLLKALCPQIHLKLMGVVVHLTHAQHQGMPGAIASHVIASLKRLAPREPRFITPENLKYEKQPPILPHQLAQCPPPRFKHIVDSHTNRLELVWDQAQIQQILTDHIALCNSFQQLSTEQLGDKTSFEHSWAFANDRFVRLRQFVGGLATAYLFKPPSSPKLSITCLELTEENPDDITIAADIILHARQFLQLRQFAS